MSEIQKKNVIVIGISGATCAGKTTVAKKLCATLPNCKVIYQDDYYLDADDPRHTWIPEVNHNNWDVLTALDMEKMHSQIVEILDNYKLARISHTFENGINGFTDYHNISNYIKEVDIQILIIEGFSIFNYGPLVPLIPLKYYFTLSKEECHQRRLLRVYDPPDVPGYFDKCVWPEYLVQLEEVQTEVEDVKFLRGTMNLEDIIQIIIKDIFMSYKNI